MSEHKKVDRRVIYTKRAIRDSFVSLIQQKPIEKISVTEICKLADINRGTFYSHYSDPYALRKSLEQELVDAITERVETLGVANLSLEQSMQLFKSQKELCRIFAGPYADKAALLDIIDQQASCFIGNREDYLANITGREYDYLVKLVASSITIVIKQWIDNGLEDDPQRIADILNQFCMHGIGSFMAES